MRNLILKNMDWIVLKPDDQCAGILHCQRCGGEMQMKGIQGHGIPVEAMICLSRGFQEVHRNCKA